MQDVNDDMDDLFRKAAEQYPLKTDGADWQKVFAGLQNASLPVAEEKEKRKRRALWLFLLLPFVILGSVYYKSDNQTTQHIAIAKEVAGNKSENDNVNSGASTKIKIGTRIIDSQKSDLNLDKQLPSATGSTDNSTSASSLAEAKNTLKASGKSDADILPGNKNNRESITSESRLRSLTNAPIILKNKKGDFDDTQVGVNYSNSGINDNKKNLLTLQPGTSSDRIDKQDTRDANIIEAKSGEAAKDKNDSVTASNIKADSTENNATNSNNKSKLVKAKPRRQTGFYAGILASFDVSTIKLQRINKTGYGFEVLVGYRFSNRFSVESGVNRTDKKYYSTGKYFDKTNTGIPDASKIIYTNGTCAMLEIPITAKYDFAQKKKSNWFATAGLSSYLMKDEQYTYYANHSGDYYTATRKYSHSGNNLFSVASLSVGYQLQLNKHLSLRAEPYIKMPLGGIGIAKMPITSTGITIGFTRSF